MAFTSYIPGTSHMNFIAYFYSLISFTLLCDFFEGSSQAGLHSDHVTAKPPVPTEVT